MNKGVSFSKRLDVLQNTASNATQKGYSLELGLKKHTQTQMSYNNLSPL